MEVNFVDLQTSGSVKKNIPHDVPAVKGNWKAKRAAAVSSRVRRAKPNQARILRRPGAGRTARLRQSEFASGDLDADPHSVAEVGEKSVVSRQDAVRTAAASAAATPPPSRARKRQQLQGQAPNADQVAQPPNQKKRMDPFVKGDAIESNAVNVAAPAMVEVVNPATIAATVRVIGCQPPTASHPDQLAEKPKRRFSVQNPEDPVKAQINRRESDVGMFTENSFESLGLYRSVATHLMLRLGIQRPTFIQEQVLRTLLVAQAPSDIIVRSETGSGKTLAYCLPIAHRLLQRTKRVSREDGAMAIVVVPTRELAQQVQDVATSLLRPWHWLVVGSVRGGENKKHEKDRLRKGVSLLVATPGRLLDHIRNTRSFKYSQCEFLVLDEADRLLDLGFEADIKECISSIDSGKRTDLSQKRSNILLSATMNTSVQRLAEFSLQNPIVVSQQLQLSSDNGGESTSFNMPLKLRQHFCSVEQKYRLVTLVAILRLRALQKSSLSRSSEGLVEGTTQNEVTAPECKIMVFFSSCDSVDYHAALLKALVLPTELTSFEATNMNEKLVPLQIFHIHGSRNQKDRTEALRGFQSSKRAILLCTDVAARGLDLKGVGFSVQYDPPTGGAGEELEYLHRAGRSARIGEVGDALIFLLPSEKNYISKLKSRGVSMVEISANTALAALVPGTDLSRRDKLSYSARLATSCLQRLVDELVQNDETLKSLAWDGFRAHCRAYATHAKDVRDYFHVRNLHLGHVARSFGIGDKPAEIAELLNDISRSEGENGDADEFGKDLAAGKSDKGAIARAIASGKKQPYNDPQTTLSKRRREGARGDETSRELAFEFGS